MLTNHLAKFTASGLWLTIPTSLTALLLAALASQLLAAGEFHVSVQGDDANPGTLAKPFATLRRAQQAARRLAGHEAVTIMIRSGTYHLPDTWVFTAADSGSQAAPVVYQAYGGEQPVISGALQLPKLKWQPYKDGILQAVVPDDLATDQIFVNGERQVLARYPNFDPRARIFNGSAADAISPQRVATWQDPAGGFIHALHGSEWGGMHYLITGKGPDQQLIYQGGWQNNRPSGMHPQHRFVENIFEELDADHEWFLDAKKHLLFFRPPAGLDLATATFEAVRLKQLVELRGTPQAPVRFVSFHGLGFRHAARTFMETKEPLLRSDWTIYRGGAVCFNGAEDCSLTDCLIDQVGGNAVFVNNYNRRLAIRGCHITRAGGSGVAFIGDPNACFNPLGWNQSCDLAKLDRTPGPRTVNFPADCVVDDCLIHDIGQVEKQTAGVTLDMAQSISIRHCSIYDMPRSGINFGDGCWGGHLIEFCDVFDTVKETGDHGSFNSWGRDRYWGLGGLDLNSDAGWIANKTLVTLDACKTTVIRNSRWRCDHGWDIDLDDGSSNYHIYNNLCLNGGLKNREGFFRVVENNILINGFHPHVWYRHSEDVFRHNIMWSDQYLPAGGMPDTPWGKEMDCNLVHRAGATAEQPATKLAAQSKRDTHSLVADALFINPASGDFRVMDGSPALKLGFVNFPMDQFGVQKPDLKAIARTPELPVATHPGEAAQPPAPVTRPSYAWQARICNIAGLGERSAYGLPDESGVLVLEVPAASPAAAAGLLKDDVIVAANGKPLGSIAALLQLRDSAAGRPLTVSVSRKQRLLDLVLPADAYVVTEAVATPDFKTIPLLPSAAVLQGRLSAGGAATNNDPLATLGDGAVAAGYGPVFANGVENGMYKLDLTKVTDIARINTFSAGSARARQNFVLYGSAAATDPGWNVADAAAFTPLIAVDTRHRADGPFEATSIRRSDGKALGAYRWLVWATFPVTDANAENTAFQELQVVPLKPAR
ncbi:MAG: PDZ domain-containing protein [Verrucomicrobiota bacterium]